MRLFKAVFPLFLALSLVGCASTGFSQADRQALKRVNIGPITLPEKPTIIAPGAGIGFLIAGPLGMAITNGASDLPTAYKQNLEKRKIDINSIVRDAVKSRLKTKGIDVVESPNEGDAVLNVAITDYGLTGSLFNNDRFAHLWPMFRMVKPNGDVIWKDNASTYIWAEVPKQVEPRPIPDLFNDPVLLEKQIRKVTEMVVEDAMRSL